MPPYPQLRENPLCHPLSCVKPTDLGWIAATKQKCPNARPEAQTLGHQDGMNEE